MQRRRDKLRAAGLRPLQIWVPDTRAEGFAEECARQARTRPRQRDQGEPYRRRGLVRHVRYDGLDGVRRGDLVTVVLPGDQGKPRPALVVQSDHFGDLTSVTVLPITGTLIATPLLRVPVEPNEQNGLAKRSQIMVDKPQTPAKSGWGRSSVASTTRPW